jgi:hypothetical protein
MIPMSLYLKLAPSRTLKYVLLQRPLCYPHYNVLHIENSKIGIILNILLIVYENKPVRGNTFFNLKLSNYFSLLTLVVVLLAWHKDFFYYCYLML